MAKEEKLLINTSTEFETFSFISLTYFQIELPGTGRSLAFQVALFNTFLFFTPFDFIAGISAILQRISILI